jgi:hypothetical protein
MEIFKTLYASVKCKVLWYPKKLNKSDVLGFNFLLLYIYESANVRRAYRITICHRINCNSLDTHFLCCLDHPAGNFSSIGNENLFKVTLIWIKWINMKCWKVCTWNWNWSIVSIWCILKKKTITSSEHMVKLYIVWKWPNSGKMTKVKCQHAVFYILSSVNYTYK